MIGRYAVVASRRRQDLLEIERAVARVERTIRAANQPSAEKDL